MIRRLRKILIALGALWPAAALGATLTVMPTPFQTVLDGNGNPINGAKVCTYVAGTTTPIATYTDVTGATPNANPILANSAGRFTAWLIPGTSYKFVYQDASGTAGNCDGVTFQTVDNVSAIPSGSAGVDIIGVTGETISLGQAVYLSAGDGGKTAGLWYKADNSLAYSSTTHAIGIATAAITSGGTGAIRISGSVPGLSSLTVGATYYVGSAGAITSTIPASNVRIVAQADTTSSLVVGEPRQLPGIVQQTCGRLTLTTATPVTTADVTAATSIFFTPIGACNQVTVWNGSAVVTDTLTQQTLAVPATTSTMYDVFAFDNAGAINIEALAWTNVTTRATAVTIQNGFYAKSGDATRKYVGSFMSSTVSGQTTDAASSRLVWNYYNRVARPLLLKSAVASWTYAVATWRQANASATNQVEFVVGINEAPVRARVLSTATQGTATAWGVGIALALDSTTVPGGIWQMAALWDNGGTIGPGNLIATWDEYPTVGRHLLQWLEFGNAGGNTSFFGNGTPTGSGAVQSGISGWIDG